MKKENSSFKTLNYKHFNTAFGIKESPVFQELRDKVAAIYVQNIDDDLKKLEEGENNDEEQL